MTRTAKLLLGGCGGLIFLGVMSIVGFVIILNIFEAKMAETTAPVENEGTEYGRTHDQQACIDEGLRRSRNVKVSGPGEGIETLAFTESCLKTARPTSGFCDGVPTFWKVEDSERWKSERCPPSRTDEVRFGCRLVFKTKQEFCRPPFGK